MTSLDQPRIISPENITHPYIETASRPHAAALKNTYRPIFQKTFSRRFGGFIGKQSILLSPFHTDTRFQRKQRSCENSCFFPSFMTLSRDSRYHFATLSCLCYSVIMTLFPIDCRADPGRCLAELSVCFVYG